MPSKVSHYYLVWPLYLTSGDFKVMVGIIIKPHYSQSALASLIATHPCLIALPSATTVPLEVSHS